MEFADAIGSLCAKQATKARKDPELWAEMIERLGSALGMSVALAARGDAKKINTLLTGLEAHIASEASSWADITSLMFPTPPEEA